jgi:hypothetical protein
MVRRADHHLRPHRRRHCAQGRNRRHRGGRFGHHDVVTRGELQAALARQRGWDGVATARRVLELASELSESPLESLARPFLADHDLPLPKQQAWVKTYRGWYRVDGSWTELGVILEVDGMLKYQRSNGPATP